MSEKSSSMDAPSVSKINDKTVMVRTPQSMNSLTATSRAIMDELRERHKGKDRPGSKPLHPTELITVDKLTDHLHKHSNLSEQAKTGQSVDQALRQISDIDNNGRDRMAYFYPFLIKNGAKVISKIAMISPQYTHEINVKNYRENCFDYSKPMLDMILSSRAKRIKEIDENHPGNFLFQKNKSGADWLYPMNGSLEAEIGILIRRGFKPFNGFALKDFVDDFIDYGNEKGSLEQIAPGYHIIIDEIELKEDGTYQRQPEIIAHYRAQTDGLEKFALMYLPKLCEEAKLSEFRFKINEFQKENVEMAKDGRKQSREKVRKLIDLVSSFPYDKINNELSKSFNNTAKQSIQLLEKFLGDMDNLIDRKYSSIYNKLNKSISNLITENTKNELTLTQIHFLTEVETSGIREEDKQKIYADRLKKDLTTNFGFHTPVDENPKEIVYFVDQSYMASVIHKLTSLATTSPEYKKQLAFAKLINQELSLQKNPKLNQNIKDDHVIKLSSDVHTIESTERERIKKELFQRKFNLPVSAISFVALMAFFLIIAFADGSLSTIIVGLLISAAISIFVGVYFRKKDSEKLDKDTKQNPVVSLSQNPLNKTSEDEDPKKLEEKISQISKVANQYVFPKKYNKIEDKLYDINSLRSKIQNNLDEIKKNVPILKKESDLNKVSSSIEYSLVTTAVVIAIPNDLVPKGKQNSVIVAREDFKSPLLRGQMSEYYREQAEKNKYDQSLVKYYTFLINTFEMEYFKFLNKKMF